MNSAEEKLKKRLEGFNLAFFGLAKQEPLHELGIGLTSQNLRTGKSIQMFWNTDILVFDVFFQLFGERNSPLSFIQAGIQLSLVFNSGIRTKIRILIADTLKSLSLRKSSLCSTRFALSTACTAKSIRHLSRGLQNVKLEYSSFATHCEAMYRGEKKRKYENREGLCLAITLLWLKYEKVICTCKQRQLLLFT